MPLADSGAALFAGSAAELITMAPASSLTTHITREFARRYGNVNESEVRSWRNSLTALARVVADAGLDSAGVGVELRLPSSSRRIDASFVGRDANGAPQVVLCELKQWDSVSPSTSPDNVMVGGQEKLHPSVQAASYADYLRESHSAFTECGYGISACAYLHNMPRTAANALRGVAYEGALREAPFYVSGDEPRLGEFLNASLSGGDGVALLPELVLGRFSPSKKLIDGIANSLKDSPIWTLLDEQRVAFNIVRGLVERAAARDEKAVVVVLGGPGTGKSVIAAHLVIAMSKDGTYRAAHTTASKAFTTNLRAVGGKASEAIFRWNKDFAHKITDENALDVLVVDEAHRVRMSSNTQYTPKRVRSEMPQADELIRAARVSVFLLDERQNVRPDEIGNVSAIDEAAARQSVPVRKITLDAQFRCNGCGAYVEWVNALMSPEPIAPGGWRQAGEYELRLFDSPRAMEEALHAKIATGTAKRPVTARLVAGYCWPWSDPEPDGSLELDVQIGAWARAWNEKSPEQRIGKKGSAPRPDRHPYYKWATEPERIREVGCIYSAQGFEFDFCGVILGNDLVWREGIGWVASKDASYDNMIAKRRHTPESLMALLQHTYRVLLTRGMKGTYIYSTDFDTREFLHALIDGKP